MVQCLNWLLQKYKAASVFNPKGTVTEDSTRASFLWASHTSGLLVQMARGAACCVPAALVPGKGGEVSGGGQGAGWRGGYKWQRPYCETAQYFSRNKDKGIGKKIPATFMGFRLLEKPEEQR